MPQDQIKPRQQACDNCRFRKVKCDRGQPCRNCTSGALRCEYLRAVRRKGPRCGHGRRQEQIRQGLPCNEASMDVFRLVAPPTQATHHGLARNSSQSVRSNGGSRFNSQSAEEWPWYLEATTPAGITCATPSAVLDVSPPSVGCLELDNDNYTKRLSQSLAAHIQVFLKHLFPIMPVVDDEFVADALRLGSLPPSRYAVIIAICAATRIQLRMDSTNPGENTDYGLPSEPQLTGEMLVNLAENALRQYNIIDDFGLDSILASFFLFASYGNLDNPRHAWFYLNQAISLSHSLEITSEHGYRDLDKVDGEKRRRVFWVLFVTERTFALQHRRAVQLRGTIAKPQIIDSECPVVMNDFVNHIQVFEQLPPSLYVWQCQDESTQLSLSPIINEKLCAIEPHNSVIESQRLDTLLTQQWLRIAMWRLAFGKKPATSSRGALLPTDLPMDAGKLIMEALSNAGPRTRDCHGIGLEQKLFDIGISLADSARISTWSDSTLEVGPKDLLACIIKSLSQARGCSSHLLPELLEHSGDILGPSSPAPFINLQWNLPHVTGSGEESALVEDITTAEPCSNDWSVDSGADFSDSQASIISPFCDNMSILGNGFEL
ncbi:hypothetical protein B0I35DRAFT_453477 [Stachybotrys elegans]|uniref:Zn(2)-C6 fungal-type domain-containing protein n=1 Tax=Stachybotrys elegans TaxID=80388 RepID=A0A8K0WM27_9HYPO|nr:hypothetical protein B0I35DRAFT_453477 [Stachybotrys elegans]